MLYIFIWAVSFVFFYQNYNFWEALFKIFDHKPYFERTEANRIRYVQSWMNNTFNFIIPVLAVYVQYNTCSNEKGFPWPSEKGGSFTSKKGSERWGWVRDDVCMMEFNKGSVMVIMIANGFLLFDLIVSLFWIKNRNSLNAQMEAHHIVAIMGFTMSIFSGYGMPMCSTASMISEVSGYWLNYKDMFSKESRNTPIGQFVQIMFFITYTFFRLIPLGFLQMRVVYIALVTTHRLHWFRQFCNVVCCINAVFILFINIYWYGLILKGLKRLLEEQGVLKKSDKVDYSALDAYEANAMNIPKSADRKSVV